MLFVTPCSVLIIAAAGRTVVIIVSARRRVPPGNFIWKCGVNVGSACMLLLGRLVVRRPRRSLRGQPRGFRVGLKGFEDKARELQDGPKEPEEAHKSPEEVSPGSGEAAELRPWRPLRAFPRSATVSLGTEWACPQVLCPIP